MFKKTVSFTVASLLCLLFSQLSAQNFDQVLRQNSAARYYLGDKDQILININVWGYVQKPGQYLVPRNTDLIALISFAGGPREGANLSGIKIVRAGEIAGDAARNGNNGQHTKVPILDVDVKSSLTDGDISSIPLLQAGDTVLIPESGGHKFRNFLGFNSILSVIAATASIALIIDRIN